MIQYILRCFKKQKLQNLDRDYGRDILSSVADILPSSYQNHFNRLGKKQFSSMETQNQFDMNKLTSEQGFLSPHPSQVNIKLNLLQIDQDLNKKGETENNTYCQDALDYFSLNNKFRLYCILIKESKAFQIYHFIFTLFFAIIFIFKTQIPNESFGIYLNESIILGIQIFADVLYFTYTVVYIISFGIWNSKYGYFRNPLAVINFISLFFALFLRQPYFYIFRILFFLEYVSQYKFFKILQLFGAAIEHQFQTIIYYTIIVFFFFYIYSVVGVEIWSGLLDHYCVNKYTNEVDSYPARLCGLGRTCPEDYICQEGYFEQAFVQISHNYTSFDYIQNSMATLFIVQQIEGWVEIQLNLADSFNKFISSGYLWLYIIINGFFLQNLIIAILLKQYQIEKISDQPNQPFIYLNSRTKITYTNEKRKSLYVAPGYLRSSKMRVLKLLSNHMQSNENRVLRGYIKQILSSKFTKYFYNFLCLANLIVLSLNDEQAYENGQEKVLAKVNLACLVLYLLEDVLRIYIWKQKESKVMLILEFFLDLISIIVQINFLETPFILNAFKGLRLLWFFNQQMNWSNYRVLLQALWKSFSNIPIILLLLLVYVIVFGVVGRNLFSGKIKYNEEGYFDLNGEYTPRANFDGLRETITSIFIIICSDQWQTIFFTTLQAGLWYPYPYFVVAHFVCKIFILPSFLTLMLDNYEEAQNEANIQKDRAVRVISSMQKTKVVPVKDSVSLTPQFEKKKYFGRLSKISDDSEKEEINDENNTLQQSGLKRSQSKFFNIQILKSDESIHANKTKITSTLFSRSHTINFKQYISNSSLFLLHNKSNLRKKLHLIVQYKYYEWGISLVILLNLVLLGVDKPLRSDDDFFDIANCIFAIVFIIDALAKILAYGFIWNKIEPKKSYILNTNNCLDFIVLIISCVDDFSIYKNNYLKAFRALRGLRILSSLQKGTQNAQLNLVAKSLLQTISLLSSMIFVSGIILWILSIVCMTFWKGKLFFCSGVSLKQFQDIINENDCINEGGKWINNITNFDTIQDSLLCLFRVIIGEGWTQIMFSVSDITDRGQNPKLNSSANYQFFYYFLIFSLNILLLNLFAGLIINNYRTIKEQIGNFSQLNEYQRQWMQMMGIMQKKKLIFLIPKPINKFRLICYNIASNKYFEVCILVILFINLIFCSSYSREEGETTKSGLFGMSLLFIIVFHIEILIKFLAFWSPFFKESINRLDLALLIVSDILLSVEGQLEIPSLHTIPLILRCLRIIKTIKGLKLNRQLRVLIDVIQDLIPTFVSVIIFIFFTIIIYALIGMQILSTTWSTPQDPQYPYFFDESYRNKSFQTFYDGCLILLEIATGQYWSLYMADYTTDTPGCHSQTYQQSQEEGIRGCGTYFAYFYFISFLVLIRIIITSLFLAMIIESYSNCQQEITAAINPYQLEDFLIKWSDYDSQGTGWITAEDFTFLMFELNPPLGFKDENSQYYEFATKSQKSKSHIYNHKKKMMLFKTEIFQKLSDYQVQIYQNQLVHFKDVCIQLAYNAVKKKNDLQGIEQIEDKVILRSIRKSWEARYPDLIGKKSQQFAIDIFAINSITDILRGVIERRKIKRRIKEMQKEKNLRELEKNENAYLTARNLQDRRKGRKKSQVRKRVFPFVQQSSFRRNKISGDQEQHQKVIKKTGFNVTTPIMKSSENKTQLSTLNFYIDPSEMYNGFPMKVVYETQKIEFPVDSLKSLKQMQLSSSDQQSKIIGDISEKGSDEINQQESLTIKNIKQE